VIRLALKEFNKHLLKVLDQNQLQILVMFKVKRPDTIAYPYKSISKLHSFYMEEFHIFEDLCLKY
jgi:hypothetical protein